MRPSQRGVRMFQFRDLDGDGWLPAGQVTLAWTLLPEVHVHDAGACVVRGPCFARHFLRSHRDMVLRGIRQYSRQGTSDDDLGGHAVSPS